MICRICGHTTQGFMNYGSVALAGAFIKEPQDVPLYPLSLHFCEKCYSVQVGEHIDPPEMFGNYFYFSSAIPTLNKHFEQYADEVCNRFKPSSVVEIGCNDGVMLRHLAKLVKRAVGVDPAANVVATATKDVQIICDFFSADLIEKPVDMIIANNVFAHIPDINKATQDIKATLKHNGVFIFEVHSLARMVRSNQYDWAYHEHVFYHSLLALENLFDRHGMRIFDIEQTGLHAGSRRYYVCRDSRPASKIVEQTRAYERVLELDRLETFQQFAASAERQKDALIGLLETLKKEGKAVAGYGACGRANTMIQYCGIDHSHMEYMIDDAPAKHGFYTPGSNFLIRNYADIDPVPDYLLVFAWSFLADIMERRKDYRGKAIIPLPDVRVLQC